MADPWQNLRSLTAARIALGRAGGSLPTGEVLKFASDHALARDAVWTELQTDALNAELSPLGLPVLTVDTRAGDRTTYLQRPDLGRRLSEGSENAVTAAAPTDGCDVAVIVGDGLSALAAQRQAPRVLCDLLPLLSAAGLTVGPIVVARQARVAVEDEIGSRLRAKCVVILIGERPGLGTADSLGAYLVFDPRPGRTDADRNCVSNIRPEGLPPALAARTLDHLIRESLVRKLSGVGLKDERTLSGPTSSASLP